MQRAKAFFFVCAGVLLRARAYQLGAADAQGRAILGNPVVATFTQYGNPTVVTANGDVYWNTAGTPQLSGWVRGSNVFSGGPTPAGQPTWGQLKTQYRK